MRVIAGVARGTRLRAPKGDVVRPTSDRLREAVFSSLGGRVEGAEVWDACAGTGAIGIEALSRGAARVLFTERSPEALKELRRNLATTRFEIRATVLPSSWQSALPELTERGRRFHVVYFDPPYAEAQSETFLAAVAPLLAPAGLILIEHRRRDLPRPGGGLEAVRTLVASNSAVTFFSAVAR